MGTTCRQTAGGFLVNALPDQAPSAPITVVMNWSAGLRK